MGVRDKMRARVNINLRRRDTNFHDLSQQNVRIDIRSCGNYHSDSAVDRCGGKLAQHMASSSETEASMP
jgi:hypothetical protein